MLIQIDDCAITNSIIVIIEVRSPHINLKFFTCFIGIMLHLKMMDDVKSSLLFHFCFKIPRFLLMLDQTQRTENLHY